MTEIKTIFIIDENLPIGVIANTAAILGVSLGKSKPDIVGSDLQDIESRFHSGITTTALPILKGNTTLLRDIRQKLYEYESTLKVIDLIDATRTTKSYEEYAEVMRSTPESHISYLGIALSGPKKIVNKLTGNLALLR